MKFSESKIGFATNEKNLRKWDAPVIADLDQDGYPDVLLNDHGLGIRVCWNNNGFISAPYDIIMGDIHGVSVGDFNSDGLIEIIMSRGGGAGSNARNSKLFTVNPKREFIPIANFSIPLALMRGRTVKFFDGDLDGDLDLINFAFPDKEVKGKSENYIYSNNGNGELILKSSLPPSKRNGQKSLLTDYNKDNIPDLIMYGHKSPKVFKGNGDLTFKDVSRSVLPISIEHVTGIVEIDFDNDGDMDLFITRGEEFKINETFYNPDSKILGFATKRGKFNFDNIKVGDVLKLENFHTQWPQTNQLYIGETGYSFEHPGETHSGKDLRIVNSDALGFPDQLDKKGIFIGYVGNQNWKIGGEIWGPLTGVIHGVSDYPQTEHSRGHADILLENNNGTFKDISLSKGITDIRHTTGVTSADLDNNGWADLVVINRGNLISPNKATIYLNNGNKFELYNNHNIVSHELGAIGLSTETIDFDKDGDVDIIIGNERGKWHLYENINKKIKGRFLNVKVNKSKLDKVSSLGAIVKINACGLKQSKKVGSTGATYSQGLNQLIHFGLGECTGPIEVSVLWTNNEIELKKISLSNSTVAFGLK